MKAIMHIHSLYSDGGEMPAEVAETVVRQGGPEVEAAVLTDHDSYQGFAEFAESLAPYKVKTMPGMEITTTFEGVDVHILAYGFVLDKEKLDAFLSPIWEMHNRRARQMLAKYQEAGIISREITTPEEMVSTLEKTVAPGPYVSKSAFKYYRIAQGAKNFSPELKRGGVAYTAYDKSLLPTPTEVVEFIHSLGGRAVLAHPGELVKRTDGRAQEFEVIAGKLLDLLCAVGLDGVEINHPSNTAGQRVWLHRQAVKRGLLVSGGSDYHGCFKPGTAIDEDFVPMWRYVKFL